MPWHASRNANLTHCEIDERERPHAARTLSTIRGTAIVSIVSDAAATAAAVLWRSAAATTAIWLWSTDSADDLHARLQLHEQVRDRLPAILPRFGSWPDLQHHVSE